MQSRINIYTSKEDRKIIDTIKVKYQLSLTTIIDVLIETTIVSFLFEENILHTFKNEYLYNKGQKTSIKMPKRLKNDEYFTSAEMSRYATNVLQAYIRKDFKKFIKDSKRLETLHNHINKELTTRKDDFWNYNQHLRNQRRMLRENKEYFRKALETA